MADPTHRMSHLVAPAEGTPRRSVSLWSGLKTLEAGREEALLECEDLRDQLEFAPLNATVLKPS